MGLFTSIAGRSSKRGRPHGGPRRFKGERIDGRLTGIGQKANVNVKRKTKDRVLIAVFITRIPEGADRRVGELVATEELFFRNRDNLNTLADFGPEDPATKPRLAVVSYNAVGMNPKLEFGQKFEGWNWTFFRHRFRSFRDLLRLSR